MARVRSAYRDLVKKWHPDRFQHKSQLESVLAEERLKEITGAYRRIAGSWTPEERKSGSRPAPKAESSKTESSQAREEPKRAAEYRPSANAAPSSTGSTVRLSMLRRLGAIGFRFEWNRRSAGMCAALLVLLLVVNALPRLQSSMRGNESQGRSASPSVPGNSVPRELRSPKPGNAPSSLPHEKPEELPAAPPVPSLPGISGEQPSGEFFFTIGSAQAEVLKVQGAPKEVRGQTWIYGVSEVSFKDGRVSRYNNFDGTLRVRLIPSNAATTEPPSFFTIGSSTDEVLLVQGTPTRLDGNRWHYGFSELYFKDGRVEGFENFFGNLKIRLLPSGSVNSRNYFTIGSSYDEVLAIQGTPSSIRGKMWSYELSSVLFRNGRVQYILNSGGNLRFIPPEDLAGKERQKPGQ